jgi:pimeloyl-ACP methyl ester carboxylesterase
MTGVEATLFRQRLARAGFNVQQFHYRSVTVQLATALEEFRDAVLSLPAPVHLVGHSLGGLLVLRLVEHYPDLPLGRIVLLGSPVNGSTTARSVLRLPGASAVFGSLAVDELTRTAAREWRHAAEVGVIAGTHSLGIGRFVSPLPEPNDGTVAVAETVLAGATAQRVLAVSHTGMMYSAEVVHETAEFLTYGRFSVPAT